MPAETYHFGSFRLDVPERQLARRGHIIPLRGKVFDTLRVLVQHAGRLVHKDELMRAIWPDSVVEENNLEHNLCVLRKVLAENDGGRKFVETVPRQGYRFVAKVYTSERRPAGSLASADSAEPTVFVTERYAQLQQLHMALEKAQSGLRQVVFLTGEAGIGKTTLVHKFLAELSESGTVRIGLGECVDQSGPGEAYMPVLEAVATLCRQSDGDAVVEVLRHRAPTWLYQIPSATTPDERLSLQHSLIGLTQERMLREGVDALQTIARDRLLILVLEDLHWSDGPTLDFLMRVARGVEPVPLLVIGTYRPAEARSRSRSVSHLVQQLLLSESCKEVPLQFLSESGIASYLDNQLKGTVPPSAARLLHQRTEGNPLFAAALVNFWIANGSLHEESDGWTLSRGAGNAVFEAPETLRQAIEERVAQLPGAERDLVEAASVAGVEFCASVVAAALNLDSADVEMQFAAMAQGGRFFASCGRSDWSDGTICERYRFIHSLYREVTYKRLPAGVRVRWHLRIGERLERGISGEEDRTAPELALHFQQGRDARRAIHYLKKAAHQCLERGAAPDAVFHLTGALEMLRRIPEQQERTRLELGIDAMLAPALGASKGFGDLETEAAFRRAYELARQLGEEVGQFPIIFGFAVMLELRGHYRKAQELMEKHLPHLELRNGCMLEALDLLACSRFHQGAFRDALNYARRGAEAQGAETHSALSGSLGENPGIDCCSWMALALWFLGCPDEALTQAEYTSRRAEDPAYSYSRTTAWAQRAFLHQLRREVKATRLWAQRTIRLAAEQGRFYREAVGKVLHGWALTELGDMERGIRELKDGIAGCTSAGAELDRPYHLALLTEAQLRTHDYHRASAALHEAIERAEAAKSFFYEAELWRLQGHMHCVLASNRKKATECYRRALDIAQEQGAKSLELRAATSMAQLLRERGERDKEIDRLARLYRSSKVSRETPDLLDARLELEGVEKGRLEPRNSQSDLGRMKSGGGIVQRTQKRPS